MASKSLKLNRTDLTKLTKSFLLSAGGAVLAIALDHFTRIDWTGTLWGPLVGAMAPFIINVIRKWLSGYK